MPSNEEILKQLKADLMAECSKMTFKFDDKPKAQSQAELIVFTEEMLKHYLGEDMQLTPEQQERFKEECLSRPITIDLIVDGNEVKPAPPKEDPNVLKCTVEMDENGRLRVLQSQKKRLMETVSISRFSRFNTSGESRSQTRSHPAEFPTG